MKLKGRKGSHGVWPTEVPVLSFGTDKQKVF